jgi:glyoxylase-like metal-dependent hydrolase (beta-lactamase superfamily II)
MEQIAPNMYVSTTFDYINVGCVVGPTGVVALDAPTLPQDALGWRREIARLTDRPIVYTVLTDAHPHRILCASLFEAPIVASTVAYQHAADYTRGFWRSVVRRLRRHHPEQEEALRNVDPTLPEILFNSTLMLHKGGVEVTIERIDGAAPGSAWIKPVEADALFLGDTLVVGQPPVMDETPDTKAWLDTLTQLRRPRFAGTTLVPGRGPLSDQAATSQLSEYIRVARRRVRSLHRTAGPQDDVASFVGELLSILELPDSELDRFRRRVRNGLKRLYDELTPRGEGRG